MVTNGGRDPRATRARILAAALEEFSARGFAGARVDRIAGRARANKRMLYHYFGNKDDLFRAILRLKLGERLEWLALEPADLAKSLPYWLERVSADPDWVRLMEWEALRVGTGPVIDERARRRVMARGVAHLRRRQAQGSLARNLDPAQVLLSLMALTTFPVAFPQVTRLVTGLGPGDPEFRRRRARFLRRLARAFSGSARNGR